MNFNNEITGYIVIDGNGCLFGIKTGNISHVVHKFCVDLPKTMGRGGEAFRRRLYIIIINKKIKYIRNEYFRKIAEKAFNIFICNGKVNVSNIVLAGTADYKQLLLCSDLLDNRIVEKISKMVDVPYGMDYGFSWSLR